jgi:hypothetical protein
MSSELGEFITSVAGKMKFFFYRCRLDEHLTAVELSDGLQSFYGHTIDAYIGNKKHCFADLIHPEDRHIREGAIAHGIANRLSAWNTEYRVKDAVGHYSWVRDSCSCTGEDDGELHFIEGAVYDIDDLYKRIEQRQEMLASAAAQTTAMLQNLGRLKLMALNTGIEAARHGSQGAGFSVLAQEIRNLADLTAAAAKELEATAV